ncbi:MAG: metal ABC transporter permease [Acidimicrobiales bacterium]
MSWLFEPGWWSTPSMRTALAVGAIVAVGSAVVGLFVVVRGQSFAGHALTDVAAAGGAGAAYAGVTQLAGFLGGTILGAGAMEAVGVDRIRRRDVATGTVLGAAYGLTALFLFLASTSSSSSGTAQTVLFGSVFLVSPSDVPTIALASLGAIVVVVVIARPLQVATLAPELARARGVRTRMVGALFLVTMAVAVGLSSVVVGSILSTALLIGPAAAALRVARRWSSAAAIAAALGVVATSLGVLLSYNSYYWSASHRSLPVSFFVVAVVIVQYVGAVALSGRRGATRARGA